MNTRLPVITAIIGVLTFAVGLVVGRIPMKTSGGFEWSADQTFKMCRSVGQLTGTMQHTVTCARADAIMIVCGLLIVSGIAAAVTGVVPAVLRARRAS